MKRFSMGKRHSKRQFTKHAVKSHRKNFAHGPMRGGIRL